MILTKNVAIIAPVTDTDDQTAREAVWQQVTERIVPQMGRLCTRFEPSSGAWGQKLSAPYSVVLGRNEPALFLYFYASAKHQLDERAKAHLDGFMEQLEIGNEQTVGDTKMCTAYLLPSQQTDGRKSDSFPDPQGSRTPIRSMADSPFRG